MECGEDTRSPGKASSEPASYECIGQGVIGASADITVPEPVAKARDCLEHLTRREPGNAAAWAALVLVFNMQRNWGFALPPEQAAGVDRRLYLNVETAAGSEGMIMLIVGLRKRFVGAALIVAGWQV